MVSRRRQLVELAWRVGLLLIFKWGSGVEGSRVYEFNAFISFAGQTRFLVVEHCNRVE